MIPYFALNEKHVWQIKRRSSTTTMRVVVLDLLFICHTENLVPCAENLYPAVGFFAATARVQVVAGRHLVLQTADVGIGGGQFCRGQTLVQDLMDGILGLQQCASRIVFRLAPFAGLVFIIADGINLRDVEDVGKGMLHLRYRIVFQDDDQLALLLRLLQTLRLAFVVILQRDYGVGITLVVGEDNGNAQLPCRLGEAVTVHAKGIDPQRLEKRRLLITILVFDRC